MTKLNIITRCTRVNNIGSVMRSIFKNNTDNIDIQWWVVFDTRNLKEVDIDVLKELSEVKCKQLYYSGEDGDFGHGLINKTIDQIDDGWIHVLDDDNILHDNFINRFSEIVKENPDKKAIIVSQSVGGRDFTGLDIRVASPDNCKVRGIDMAQFILRRDLLSDKYRIPSMNYAGDGMMIEQIFNENSNDFVFVDEVLCHYNGLSTSSWVSSPKVLYIGDDKPELKSYTIADWESSHLNTIYRNNDSDITSILNDFNPQSIIIVGDISKGKNILNHPPDIRRRAIHLNEIKPDIGESSYKVAMNWILDLDRRDTVSYFTPIYNTGDKLRTTYRSLVNQTINNWEWVIVNDSTDGGKTLKIAEELASDDNRIKVYDFRKKSGGIVGESKYRSAVLCSGEILAELDHDDYLMPECTEMLLKASNKYPEAGFFYTDCVELTSNWDSPKFYGDGFAFGYGHYREEFHLGRMMNVAESFNINPKTIRHIVGVPNHVRAWRRSVYMKIGGHNRNLSIADDFELVIRTFLETKFVRIPKLGYLQIIHDTGNNTHNLSRADIQRRVRTIGEYYNQKIKDRFVELGVNDWAYDNNPHYPLNTPSRFGQDEERVNIIYEED
jgi:glycosyltransferase involved in cell wall biosynthesis